MTTNVPRGAPAGRTKPTHADRYHGVHAVAFYFYFYFYFGNRAHHLPDGEQRRPASGAALLDRGLVTGFGHVADEYDEIGRDYQESKQLPFRRHIEHFTTFALLPDLSGRTVVDLACGEGIYSRALKAAGAERVVGVDISAEMIQLARQAEEKAPLGIEYVEADVAAWEVDERFDVALCSFLFNYARDRIELRSLARSVAGLLKPGSLVVGCNDYPANPPSSYGRYRPYGFIKIGAVEPVEGSTITYRFFNPDGSAFDLDNYFLSPETYQDEFAAAGFRSFEWVMPTVSPEGRRTHPEGFWNTYLEDPPMVSFRAETSW